MGVEYYPSVAVYKTNASFEVASMIQGQFEKSFKQKHFSEKLERERTANKERQSGYIKAGYEIDGHLIQLSFSTENGLRIYCMDDLRVDPDQFEDIVQTFDDYVVPTVKEILDEDAFYYKVKAEKA